MDANCLSRPVLDSITDLGIFAVDPDGKIVFWNKGAQLALGYAAEEIVGQHESVLFPYDTPGVVIAKVRDEREEKGGFHRVDNRLLRKDGTSLTAALSSQPMHDASGAQLGHCNVIIPKAGAGASDQRFADEQFRILVQGVVDYAIYMLDPEGCVHTWNSGAERIKGYTADEIIGHHFSAFYTEPDRAAGEPARGLAHARKHGRFENKAWRVRKDGSLFWAHVVIDRIDDDEGRLIGFAKITRDATEVLRAEEALEEMRSALHQAQKMEAIGQLTGGIAHDFNNILQVITGNLQLLLQEVGQNELARKRVRNAMAGVERGSTLASQLLAFGRRQPLEPRVINPARLIRGMDELLRRTLGEGVEIETIIGGGLWNTSIDPTNLESAILNLAINARDATEGRGKLTIEAGNAYLDDRYVRAHHEVKPGQYVLIAVTDNGCGIDADALEKVFEPFFSTKPEGSGTGLGLSMVYGFVKQSGGHIKIYSEPGHGTTVKLYLPRSTEAERELPSEPAEISEGGHESILVVEDDEAVREAAVALLRSLGYTVYHAANARAALSVVESGIGLDLLFTDVVMPGDLRSPELARLARERLPQLAVLFTSGYTENAIVHAGRLDEGVHLLSKPYTRDALARKVRQVLSEERRQPGASSPVAPPPVSKRRLMICEDDELIRSVVQDMLESKGYEVVAVGSAEDALQAWEVSDPIDLLITDLSLPGSSGVELAQTLRERTPDLPVIFATGLAEDCDMPTDERTATLLKPYGAGSLVASISRLLQAAEEGAVGTPAG
jgi:PAS domain S-box-containing protein